MDNELFEIKNKMLNSNLSFAEIVKEMKKYSKEEHSFDNNIKIAVIGSTSIQYFTSILKYNLNIRGLGVEVYESQYDGINSALLNFDEKLISFSPKFVVVLPYYTDIKSYPSLFANEEEYERIISAEIERQRVIWNNLERIKGVQVLQCNYVIPFINSLGSFEANTINSRNNYIRDINKRLLTNKPSFVTIVDLDAFASQVGKNDWFDFSGYFTTKSGFNLKYILPVTNQVCRLMISFLGKPKKCLVMDLDNTLWGDVVGDVGYNGIILDPNDPEGEAFRFFQSYIKQLKERGVILAVCSKNDEKNAKEPFIKNPNMILSLDDISCFVANWENKASNIEMIAKTLNIGIDSLVFVDDNKAEREIVRQTYPDVLVVDLPDDPDNYASALFNSGAFDWAEITKEDVLRSNTYIENAKREELLKSNVDYDSYLDSLQMEAQISKVDNDSKERFIQLINKSNQFNLTTKRTNESIVQEMLSNPAIDLLTVTLKDRFSYYGIIACLIIKQENKRMIIDTFVMSCRVLKRGLEDLIFNYVAELADKNGCDEIIGEYIKTDRNSMVEELYDKYGFTVISMQENNKLYSLKADEYKKNQKIFIQIKQ